MQQNNSSDSDQLDEKPLDLPDLHEEIASIRDSLNQTRTEMSLYRRRSEKRQEEVDAHIRRTNGLWIAMLLAIGGLATAVFFGFHSGALVVRSPATEPLSGGVQAHLSSPQENTAKQAPENGSTSSESDRTPVTNENENTRNVQPKPDSTNASSDSDTRLPVDAVHRSRIDFQISRNKTEEVAPGIFLTVRDTNVERQQINGWLQISAEGRTVWLRDQGAQKVMRFTTKHDERSHELVFTRIGKQGVAGYLLIPMTTG